MFSLFHHVKKEFWKPDHSCYKFHPMTQKLCRLFKNQSDFCSYRPLNIPNVARVSFKQRPFIVLREKLNLANLKNNLMYQPLMYTVFELQKPMVLFKPFFAHHTIELQALFTYLMFIVEKLWKEPAEKPLQKLFLS